MFFDTMPEMKPIFLSPPYMFGNERELVDEAFASNYIAPCGPMVERFEQRMAEEVGVPYACALSSCTAALDLLFYELGIGAGDTVFCSNLTFIASIAPAVHRGATPVFIGSDANSWTISPALLEEALKDARRSGQLPKAVIAVDLYGQCCDYDQIEKICQEFDLPLIVDAAEALGAVYCGHQVAAMERVKGRLQPQSGCNEEGKRGEPPQSGCNGEGKRGEPPQSGRNGEVKECRQAGDAGWAGVYSFNGNKIITSSGGGMLVSRDAELVRRACKRSQQSRDAKVWYEHSELGYNYRMSNIVAAIGLGQLLNLEQVVEKKRGVFEAYKQQLSDIRNIEFMPEADYGRCNRWLTVAMIAGENDSEIDAVTADEPSDLVQRVIQALGSENIEARPVWKPMHLQPVFEGCQVYGDKVDEEIFRRGICFPSGIALSEDDITRVSEIIRHSL